MENNSKAKILSKKKGTVVSAKGDKTIVVAVETYKSHSKYKKKYRDTKRYKVHDAENKYEIGNVVEFKSCRPMSGGKKYIVIA